MATIGVFDLHDGKYVGTINTLTVHERAEIVPAPSGGDRAPTHHVLVNKVQVGAGWTKTSPTNGSKYISIRIDDPSFPAPLFCRLVQQGDVHHLIWVREDAQSKRSAESTGAETSRAA